MCLLDLTILIMCGNCGKSSFVEIGRSYYLFSEIQASGVKVDPSCKNAYDLLHNKHQHSYIIFKVGIKKKAKDEKDENKLNIFRLTRMIPLSLSRKSERKVHHTLNSSRR